MSVSRRDAMTRYGVQRQELLKKFRDFSRNTGIDSFPGKVPSYPVSTIPNHSAQIQPSSFVLLVMVPGRGRAEVPCRGEIHATPLCGSRH